MTPQDRSSDESGPKGHLFILSAPSGAGKSTLCNALLDRFPDMVYSISFTTRPPRGSETDGVEYHFTDKPSFLKGIEENRWAEWAEVHGNYYGTSADMLDRELNRGRDVLLDIDVQGTFKILERYPEAVTIFIMPPTFDTLRERMEKRGTDSREVIERRLENARSEIAQKDRYRHVIVNDDLETAVSELNALIESYRRS
ncbi:MAG: guanylate kinase [Thermodesulfobacteriota bacterium]